MTPFKKIFLLFTLLFLYLLVNISAGDEAGQHLHAPQTASPPEASGKGIVINEYTIPTPYSYPFGIAIDSKDNIWFTTQSTNKIVKFDSASQTYKEYQIPSTADLPKSEWKYSPTNKTPPKDAHEVIAGSPGVIVADKNDKLWFVEQLGNKIGSFDPATEKFVEYDVPTPRSNPYDIAIDSEGNVWFVEWNAGKVGKLDFKSKKVKEYSFTDDSSRFGGIAIDSDDNIWVGDITMNEIGRFDPKTNIYKAFPISTHLSQPGKIIVDGSKNIWFTQVHSHKIGMLTQSTGVISDADVPGYNSVPQSIIFDKKGRLWYVDNMRNKIGYFEIQSASFNEFDIPTMNAQPANMATDSKGDIWFTESDRGANKIARVVMSTVPDVSAIHVHSEEAKGQEGAGRESAVSGNIPLWVYASGILLIAVIISAVVFIKKKAA